MKKVFEILLSLLFIIFIYLYLNNSNLQENEIDILELIEDDFAVINDYYVYGNHFNITGNLKNDNLDIDNYTLILKSNDEEYKLECNFYVIDNTINFSTSGLINQGINLDKLNIGNYYLLIKYMNNDDNKYYSIKNNTEYKDIEYYTITNNNKNNKINIVFKNKKVKGNNIDYVQFNIKDVKLPNDVYDITVDPGHGGIDTGASYNYSGTTYYESNLTLSIAIKLKQYLEKYGYKVFLTRNSDKDLEYYNESGRAVLPNKYHTKLCISIHLNSEKTINYGGVEVYIPNDVDNSLARLLASNLSNINGYSKKKFNKIEDGIYLNAFTKESIIKANKDNVDKGLNEYDITEGAPEMYMIREVGGKATHAYVDGRNDKFGLNPYYNSNQTAESYLIELGYITFEEDLIKFIENSDAFSQQISKSIREFYN